MSPVQQLRAQAGVSQQTLATLAGTSQPTIAAYESGDKSPTFATLQRLASSLGLELVVTYAPPLTREDQRSLAYHQAIAKLLKRDFQAVLCHAKANLERLITHHPGAQELLYRWRLWLDLPEEELVSRLLDPGMLARNMRQVTPFAGLLTPKERARILKKFRQELCT